MAKDCADCGLEGRGLEFAGTSSRFRDLGSPSIHAFVGRFGFCTGTCRAHTPRELRGPILRPLLGPRSS
eukprot:3829409-Alexandrium_andersonii.AAC.1